MSKFVNKIKNIERERDLNEKYKIIPYSFKDRVTEERVDIEKYPFVRRVIYRDTIAYALNFKTHYELSRYGDFLGENTRFYANLSIRHRHRVKFEKIMLIKIFSEKTNTDPEWFINYIYKFLLSFGNIEYNYYFKNYNYES